MLLWFVVMAPILVAEVFRSPMVDYRVVALGALLPVAEGLLGGPFILHTLAGAVGALVVVMAATVGQRLRRRRWLGIPIGLLLHLVLDGTWMSRERMWWPVFGLSFDGEVPEFSSVWPIRLGLEGLAVAAGVWAWRRYELAEGANRDRLLRTGQLGRGVL